jgi:hypothetical protein
MFRDLPDNIGGINYVRTTGWRGKSWDTDSDARPFSSLIPTHTAGTDDVVCVGMSLSGGHVVEA